RHTQPRRIDVVGLGPAGPEYVTQSARDLMTGAERLFIRTTRHPAAVLAPGAQSFDDYYEHEDTFDGVYRAIVTDLVEAARTGPVVYAVPGSPLVAERTVTLLRAEGAVVGGDVAVIVHPALSFLDLAYARLGVDPLAEGVRLVDGESFATDAAGMRGPLLVGQCWSRAVLSGIKLATDPSPGTTVTVLQHLGLPDEAVWELPWEELDRSFEPDHLTSLWIRELGAPVAGELARLDELVHTLRERCPWDREQTHGSLSRHLLEESYEVLEAIDGLVAVDADATASPEQVEHAVAHLEEELGDLLFQVYFHAALAAEDGRFSLADVARGVHDKLVSRHPHVFGDVVVDSPDQVANNWEALKKVEKGRASVTDGIPKAMPALALAAKLQRKALTVDFNLPDRMKEAAAIGGGLDRLLHEAPAVEGMAGEQRGNGTHGREKLEHSQPSDKAHADPSDVDAVVLLESPAEPSDEEAVSVTEAEVGDLLFSMVSVARQLGVDPETALRARSVAFRQQVAEHEQDGAIPG
ncbi:MAG TPA: MazG nucleotide pyrophosphohydrolase domain-containing protein, partial [Acidimicrobiales bacterium]|nr:MazG nucleotide pyrophosphohydrolase domain-containing protein [Acidimicrobiales bacterium]